MADMVTPPAANGTGDASGFPNEFMAALARAGIDPSLTIDEAMTPALRDQIFRAEGRERARPRYQQALERAQRFGYEELRKRIEGLVEAEAERHARRAMRRSGGIGSDAVAVPSPSRTVAPPLPVPGASSPMTLGPIDYTAPLPGSAPMETAGSTQPPLADAIARWGLEQGGTVGDLAVRAGRGVGNLGRVAGDVSGYFGGRRTPNFEDTALHAFGQPGNKSSQLSYSYGYGNSSGDY